MYMLTRPGKKPGNKQWQELTALCGGELLPGYREVVETLGFGDISGWLTLLSVRDILSNHRDFIERIEEWWHWDERLIPHRSSLVRVAETPNADELVWSPTEGYWLLPADTDVAISLKNEFSEAIDALFEHSNKTSLRVFCAEGVEAEELRVKSPIPALMKLLQTLPGADVRGLAGEHGPSLAAWLPRAQVFLSADEVEGQVNVEIFGKNTDIAHITGRLAWLSEPKPADGLYRLELSHPDGDRFWQGRVDGWRFEQLSGKFGAKPSQKSRIFSSEKEAMAALEEARTNWSAKGYEPVSWANPPSVSLPWLEEARFEILAHELEHATTCRSKRASHCLIYRGIPMVEDEDEDIDQELMLQMLAGVALFGKNVIEQNLVEVTALVRSCLMGLPANGLHVANSIAADEDWQQMLAQVLETHFRVESDDDGDDWEWDDDDEEAEGDEEPDDDDEVDTYEELLVVFWVEDDTLREDDSKLRSLLKGLCSADVSDYSESFVRVDYLDGRTQKQVTLVPYCIGQQDFGYVGDFDWTDDE